MKPAANKPRFRPETFGKFTLIAPIATGGMGELFLARMSATAGFERLVVIKRILPHLTDKPEFVDMFVDEARVAAQIHHPNVCQILEFGQIEGRYYMALEYLEGISMTQVIVAGREHENLRTLRFLIAIMTQVCEGLHFAHNLQTPNGALAGVVHRDVNPKNIFVTSAGVAKVIDFGIVKALGAINVTRTGSVKGTYSYMSPEQIKATAVDRRSDVFSLGTVTWEAITGVRLFKRENDFHTWRAITEDPIPPPSQFREGMPQALDDVLGRALEREKSARYATARDFTVALEKAIESEGGPLTPVAVASRIENAFVEEFESQQKRTHSPMSIDDDDEDEGDFVVQVAPPEPTVTPSGPSPSQLTGSGANRASAGLYDTGTAGRPLVSSAPITGSNLSAAPVTGSAVRAPYNQATLEQSQSHSGLDTLAKHAGSPQPREAEPSQVSLAPVSLGSHIKEPRKRGAMLVALLMIAAIFTLAAVLYVTRRGPDKSEGNGQAAAQDKDNVDVGDTSADNNANTDDKTDNNNSDNSKNDDGTNADGTNADGTNVDGTSAGSDDPGAGRVDPAEAERARRAKEAADKAAAEREAAEKRDKEKAKREKEKREKKQEKEREREKERREKDKREKDKREKELAALPPGTLNVSSYPFGTVYINGKSHGISPVTGLSVKPGRYKIRIESAEGTHRRTVTVDSGKLRRVFHRF